MYKLSLYELSELEGAAAAAFLAVVDQITDA
jgi:hypothetical protein